MVNLASWMMRFVENAKSEVHIRSHSIVETCVPISLRLDISWWKYSQILEKQGRETIWNYSI